MYTFKSPLILQNLTIQNKHPHMQKTEKQVPVGTKMRPSDFFGDGTDDFGDGND